MREGDKFNIGQRSEMANEHKAAKRGGELIPNAKEISKVEQYWHLAGQPTPRIPPKGYHYVEDWLIYSSS